MPSAAAPRPYSAFDDPRRPTMTPAAERAANRLIRDYESARARPRDPTAVAAYAALAEHVRGRGGWIQSCGVRYVWSRSEAALVRQPLKACRPGVRVPVKV